MNKTPRKEIMNWIKIWLQKWLGILVVADKLDRLVKLHHDLVNIGVDVHFKQPHMILIYSKLNGGQIRHIEADFTNIRELEDFIRELKMRFMTEKITIDAPNEFKRKINL